jgi:hypothetical protein
MPAIAYTGRRIPKKSSNQRKMFTSTEQIPCIIKLYPMTGAFVNTEVKETSQVMVASFAVSTGAFSYYRSVVDGYRACHC